jgi:hypothetical protein
MGVETKSDLVLSLIKLFEIEILTTILMVMETAYICEFRGANQLYGTIQRMQKQNIEVMKQNKREIRKKDSN